MIKTSYQVPELRNANDEVVQEGAFGKNTALSNSTNDGWIDYVMNDLEALHDTIGDSAATLDGNGHVIEPCNLAIGDEDGNRLKTSYLKLTGGTVAGTVNVAQNLKMQDNQENVFGGLYVPSSSSSEQYLVMYGGESPASGEFGARLRLYGAGDGKFQLIGQKADGSTSYTLTCTDAGNLTWRGNTLAPLASPAFTGNPTATTQALNNSSTRLATTEYVVNNEKANTFTLSTNNVTGSISNGDDLDDYVEAGTYTCGSSTIAASLSNCPYTTSNFKLVVVHTAGTGSNAGKYSQQYLYAGSTRGFYIRNRNNGNWGEWGRLAMAQEVVLTSGGTTTGAITRESTNITAGFVHKSTNLERGVAPASLAGTSTFDWRDSNNATIGGLYRQINTSNVSELRLYNYWTTSEYVDLYMSAAGACDFRAGTDNSVGLGVASRRWSQLFAGTTTISTSDERLKTNITDIPNDVLDAWGEVGWVQFQFTESVAEKGETYARVHTGAIAQRIKAVFEAHNLDPFKYGLLCYDEWDYTPAERDEQDNITTPAQPAGNRYSLRYEEALCMEAAYQRRRADRLEARIEALERALNV